jgi:hypothetical protein
MDNMLMDAIPNEDAMRDRELADYIDGESMDEDEDWSPWTDVDADAERDAIRGEK